MNAPEARNSAPQPPRTISVIIADDHPVVREGLRTVVEAQSEMVVLAEASDGQEAWQRSCELKPDVLVLDISMPGVGGAEAAERIGRDCPDVRVLALTMHEERGYVSRLIRSGASGYVLKRSAASELVRAIRAVAAGGMYVDPSLAGSLLSTQQSKPTGTHADRLGGLASLTPRETEVLRLVARGHSNKEVAAALEISVKTVETHKANAMTKLGLKSRAALVRFGIEERWLQDS